MNELERLVTRLLAKDPAQRPTSAGKVWAALNEINDRHFGATPPNRGRDIAHDISVSRAEATDGAIIPLRITAHKACPVCATRTDEKTARACTTCKGEGSVVREQGTCKVRIPAGLRDGKEIRIRELGEPGKHGGAPGDMYVTMHIDR
ncbi:serine/threonine protein kinase [Streptomyces laculatispora]|nr:DnaJ C-terminal domain-containing protein [Streptomyces laculatispora]MBO0916429.1 serine/threonine protein kinase [Streptomyces laculatispora]